MADGVVVDQEAGFEVIGTVEDNAHVRQKIIGVLRVQIRNVSFDPHVRVSVKKMTAGGFRFGQPLAGVGLGVEELALQVALLNVIAVYETQGSQTGADE
jgi:hypothetical protein